ncbi:HET domain-containing protein [Fusarium keratoplasticum]|nr:HET domain-containing protein [Fusarium keratoplasticum]
MLAWSDTCCIDKSSSAELDEAIRSMFRWYRNSSICFIHLARTTSLEDLQSDEWFVRGWTLQELLAPRVTKFFDKDWHPLVDGSNHKENSEILQHVIAATRCPEHALRDFTPGPFSVGGRMIWAARRKTTRGEDMAYSMMGIFDVTLQTAYGEGAERAFTWSTTVMSDDFRIWTEPKSHSLEGHIFNGTLLFNGNAIWGPRSCHDNTVDLINALSDADPRFTMSMDGFVIAVNTARAVAGPP